ncbi:MAG: hypothetical protein GZ088_09565 [Acidipila sp.]|nr:hypothetical protein [Acidipila sp.]
MAKRDDPGVPIFGQKKDNPEVDNFFGVAVPVAWLTDVVRRIRVLDREYFTNAPIVNEGGAVACAQAFEAGENFTIFEHRCLVFYNTPVECGIVVPPPWWEKVIEKKYVLAR